jgi:AcrR family transcriptional regulator
LARRYRQARRKDSAAETRERIVRATFELHSEKGVVATSMRDIAERAGVSIGSVYNHFPTYDHAISACGAYASSFAPAPGAEIFAGAEDRAERVRRLASATFAHFERLPALGYVAAEQDKLPVLKPFLEQERAGRLALAAAAVAAPEGDEAARTLAALLDLGAYRALTGLGLSTGEAAARIAEVANAWLDLQQPRSRRENGDGNPRPRDR